MIRHSAANMVMIRFTSPQGFLRPAQSRTPLTEYPTSSNWTELDPALGPGQLTFVSKLASQFRCDFHGGAAVVSGRSCSGNALHQRLRENKGQEECASCSKSYIKNLLDQNTPSDYLRLTPTTTRLGTMADTEPPAKKKCLGVDCENEAGSLQCPTCLKLGIKGSFFCSQDCFKKSWVC